MINIAKAQTQYRRFDSTFKMGKTGFRIVCNNKNDENTLAVKLIGFENTAHDQNYAIKGRVVGGEIDDLNSDGFPDLVLYMVTGPDGIYGQVYGFASEQNKSIVPFALPDVMLDGKLNQGYKGHDQFSLLEGVLMQKFPIYKPDDEKDKPTGGNRVVMYQMVASEGGGFKFKMTKSYDLK